MAAHDRRYGGARHGTGAAHTLSHAEMIGCGVVRKRLIAPQCQWNATLWAATAYLVAAIVSSSSAWRSGGRQADEDGELGSFKVARR